PRARDVDMLVIRENSEGEYVGQGGRLHRGTPFEIATQLEVFSRHATERLIRYAFLRAAQRLESRCQSTATQRTFVDERGTPKQAQVCLITKRNALPHWGELYSEVFAEIAEGYPDIATHHELVDAACMKFVQCPWQFDVVVASNLQGDILTDLAAVLSGGMGVASSGNINPDDRTVPPMFEPTHGSAPDIAGQDDRTVPPMVEPTHGSAPDIAGQGKADPRAMLLTAANMLEWMGVDDPVAAESARRLRRAVEQDMVQATGQVRSTEAIGRTIVGLLQDG
ncbi:MAG: isocitrate/isopropylmalate family dehydrogenase, partial [Desulfuromonadales bacterium]